MEIEELISNGDACVRKALANMYAILDGNGMILTKVGGGRMAFSPRLECDGECSALLFDDEDKANGAIEEILLPQDDTAEYHVFRFTPVDDVCCGEDGCCDDCDGFDIEPEECDVDGCGCGCGCGDDCTCGAECGCDDDADDGCECGGMRLDDAIDDIEGAMLEADSEGDAGCAEMCAQVLAWLKELRETRKAASCDGDFEKSDNPLEEEGV